MGGPDLLSRPFTLLGLQPYRDKCSHLEMPANPHSFAGKRLGPDLLHVVGLRLESMAAPGCQRV